MCGIAGVVGEPNRAMAENAVAKMVSALARRGPDSEGIEIWDDAVLGHRRLAIFDLSEAGRQPMVSKDRSVSVVFNGAIYNYRSLRKELVAGGYLFRSNTDTEVLIHGYQEWGLDRLLSKLRGMFAFGLWDNARRKLYLVRDRLGVKPLVFSARNGTIAFASTLRALRTAGFLGDLDENAVMDFLLYGFVPDDRCIYQGAVKVQAGSIVEWSNGILREYKYWEPPVAETSRRLSFDEAVEQTEHLLLDSVSVRLHADVPVGALLSGGIDSSLICWAAARLGADITAYTIGTPGDPWDEAGFAVGTAQTLGIQHRVLEMSDGDMPETKEFISAYAEPFACASALGMLRVSRTVNSCAKVLLTGDGGDETFLGYPQHRHLWFAQKLSQVSPSFLKNWWLASRFAFPRMGLLRRAAALFDYTAGGLDAYLSYANCLPMYRAQRLLGDRLLNLPLVPRQNPSPTTAGDRVLGDYLDYERKGYFVGEFMTKVDGATMHYGVEARSPFLDQFLWEFASSIPFDLRLHRGRLKSILRELARRRIGSTVANRRKRGFGVPVQRWILGRWRPVVEAALRDSILDQQGWIHSSSAMNQLRLATPRGWAPAHLWYLFVLESWIRYEQGGESLS